MDVHHLILSYPRQYDVRTIYSGRSNTYSLSWKGKHMKLQPTFDKLEGNNIAKIKKNIVISNTKLLTAYKETHVLFVVFTREVTTTFYDIPSKEQKLMEIFDDICSTELPSVWPCGMTYNTVSILFHHLYFLFWPAIK